ncbi:MAG: OmpA family protein [Bacteroidota bacterium]
MIRTLLVFLISHSVFAQNLLSNGGFEKYKVCPKAYLINNEYSVLIGWESPDEGTPDYYNRCGEGDAKVPQTWAGRQYPFNGDGFAGLYVWGKSGYREYLQAELITKPLSELDYGIRITYALANNSPFACDWLCIRILDETGGIISTLSNYEVIETNPVSGWITALFKYKANGNENYLIIGNYHNQGEIELIEVPRSYREPMLVNRSYYFIDNASFQLFKEESFLDIQADIPVVLEFVYFDFDESVIRSNSFSQLDKLAEYIQNRPNEKYDIIGHTDNTGSNNYNMKLSLDRAKAVVAYLVNKGVDKRQLHAIGKGAHEPIALNKTTQGRELNRRVTFTLLSQ